MNESGNDAAEVLHATVRGVIAAMAMSGFRIVTVGLGLVDDTPPREIAKKSTKGLIKIVPKKRRQAAIELLHWSVGGLAGAIYGALPDDARRRAWSGPVYGLVVLGAYEAGAAPLLGLSHARKKKPEEHLSLAADHLLFGLVLSEFRERPRD